MPWDEPTTLTVVICCYSDARWGTLCLAVSSVRDQHRAPDELILVVDHNPSLLARARDAFPRATVIPNEFEAGLSGSRNAGVLHATGDVIGFLDDDAVAPPHWCDTLLHAYDTRVAAVGGAAVPAWRGEAPTWLPAEFSWVVGCSWQGLPTTASPVRNLIGTNMSVRRDVLREVGAFATSVGRVGSALTGCEETELCIRIRQRWPEAVILYLPELTVDHHQTPERAQISYFARRCWSEGRSKARIAQLVGTARGLESERRHATRVIPAAFARACRDAARFRRGAWGRMAALSSGLLLTGGGFVFGRAHQLGRRHHE
ncbi:MAG TPA: glycosyltransferase family 2 protein [Acidimicrobiales bacterium]|nr:glycosyltransferase family 2 protein [Acidimicrobiales bacterium]